MKQSTPAQHRQIVDELIDGYVTWREACAAVAVAYENWKCAERRDETLGFIAYGAALDHEGQAAAAYQRAITQVEAAKTTGDTAPDFTDSL